MLIQILIRNEVIVLVIDIEHDTTWGPGRGNGCNMANGKDLKML